MTILNDGTVRKTLPREHRITRFSITLFTDIALLLQWTWLCVHMCYLRTKISNKNANEKPRTIICTPVEEEFIKLRFRSIANGINFVYANLDSENDICIVCEFFSRADRKFH